MSSYSFYESFMIRDASIINITLVMNIITEKIKLKDQHLFHYIKLLNSLPEPFIDANRIPELFKMYFSHIIKIGF